jgi:hypothetical protein
MTSAEFVEKHGELTNEEFVKLLYRQVLLREPSATEVAFQIAALQTGSLARRVAMAQSFLNAEEFRRGVGPRLTAFLLYATLHQRGSTQTELLQRIFQITAGTSIQTLVEEILGSSEFAISLG